MYTLFTHTIAAVVASFTSAVGVGIEAHCPLKKHCHRCTHIFAPVQKDVINILMNNQRFWSHLKTVVNTVPGVRV